MFLCIRENSSRDVCMGAPERVNIKGRAWRIGDDKGHNCLGVLFTSKTKEPWSSHVAAMYGHTSFLKGLPYASHLRFSLSVFGQNVLFSSANLSS